MFEVALQVALKAKNSLTLMNSSEKELKKYELSIINDLLSSAFNNTPSYNNILQRLTWSSDLNLQVEYHGDLILNLPNIPENQNKCSLSHVVILRAQNDSYANNFIIALTKKGATPNMMNSWGISTLSLCAQRGFSDTATTILHKILENHGSITYAVNHVYSNSYSFLHIAAICKQTQFLQQIIDRFHDKIIDPKNYAEHVKFNFDVCTTSQNGILSKLTALHFAVMKSNVTMVRLLLANGASDIANHEIGSPLAVAVACKHHKIIELLIAADFNLDINPDSTAILEACRPYNPVILEEDYLINIISQAREIQQKCENNFQDTIALLGQNNLKPYLLQMVLKRYFDVTAITEEEITNSIKLLIEHQVCSMKLFADTYANKHPNEFTTFDHLLKPKEPFDNNPFVLVETPPPVDERQE